MSDKKNIAIIRSNYTPYGGVETTTLNIMNGLLKHGVFVTLLTLPYQKWPISHENLKIIPLGIHRINRLWQAFIFNFRVNKYLLSHSFENIFSLDKVSYFTHLHAGGGTHKAFLNIREQESPILERMFRKISLFHLYMLYLEKKGFSDPRLKKVRCPSNLVKEDIKRDYGVDERKLPVIHNSIDWKGIGESFKRRYEIAKDIYNRHGLNPGKHYLLFLGSGFQRKGLDIAINGLNALPDSYHMIVVGYGSTFPFAQQAASLGLSSRVHFLGAQKKGWQYASICKALVLPSRYDPFGLAPAEGHAMGLPVLVSDKTGYADRVISKKNGVILQTPMNQANITDAFKKLARLIEYNEMTADEIREYTQEIDNDIVSARLIRDFLEIL